MPGNWKLEQVKIKKKNQMQSHTDMGQMLEFYLDDAFFCWLLVPAHCREVGLQDL